ELHKALSAQRGEPDTRLFRLPTETEWEWAASGGKRPYPWSEEKPDKTNANYDEEVGQTTPVGAYPAGATPEGLMDMAGNVWEWMENLYGHEKYPVARALRGGSWVDLADDLRCAARDYFNPADVWDLNIGFRLVCVPS
ncbi:MAG: formylglycine-generating enzyme family protein, partial [bacterium]